MFENRFIRALRIDWNKIPEHSYLHRITALSGLTDLSFSKNITFFVGENGTGKSTLLEAIAAGYGFNPEGGTLNYRFSTYDDVSELCTALTFSKGLSRIVAMSFCEPRS